MGTPSLLIFHSDMSLTFGKESLLLCGRARRPSSRAASSLKLPRVPKGMAVSSCPSVPVPLAGTLLDVSEMGRLRMEASHGKAR